MQDTSEPGVRQRRHVDTSRRLLAPCRLRGKVAIARRKVVRRAAADADADVICGNERRSVGCYDLCAQSRPKALRISTTSSRVSNE
jgi:hypothetical protein